ncbi:hypothetical protein [Motilimonas eburnea]|uniref:hypothetical protein n=1 Tax=Motilimonas eburnea TaxID=1737488 RepID=UPI001E43390D|nr:hypothetical protein [Motilimonas eburnea]MCE2571679.1 hypothetical protein [Motilimonas eburnea]
MKGLYHFSANQKLKHFGYHGLKLHEFLVEDAGMDNLTLAGTLTTETLVKKVEGFKVFSQFEKERLILLLTLKQIEITVKRVPGPFTVEYIISDDEGCSKMQKRLLEWLTLCVKRELESIKAQLLARFQLIYQSTSDSKVIWKLKTKNLNVVVMARHDIDELDEYISWRLDEEKYEIVKAAFFGNLFLGSLMVNVWSNEEGRVIYSNRINSTALFKQPGGTWEGLYQPLKAVLDEGREEISKFIKPSLEPIASSSSDGLWLNSLLTA